MVSAKVARHTRMKNANVAGCSRFDVTDCDLIRSGLRIKLRISGRRTFGSLSRLKNDRCEHSCLSKIAHMRGTRVAAPERQESVRAGA